jgi:hypothetical protein
MFVPRFHRASRKTPMENVAELNYKIVRTFDRRPRLGSGKPSAAAMGLDPGIGLLHVDTDARDSLACDLMEPVRPQVDAYLLDWLTREPLRREWFFEQRDGNCRLMGSFAVRLSETARTWGRAVAPIAEWVARELWSTVQKPTRQRLPATRLTQSHKREAKGTSEHLPAPAPPKPIRVCRGCGAPLIYGKNFCSLCGVVIARDELIKNAQRGRIAAQSREAQARRTETQRRNANAQRAWEKSGEPRLSEETYRREIQARRANVTVSVLMSALNVCESYAADIRRGAKASACAALGEAGPSSWLSAYLAYSCSYGLRHGAKGT